MDFIEALSHIIANEKLEDSTNIPTLVVDNYDAAELLSVYINMEGGTGHKYGKFNSAERGDFWKVSYDSFEDRSDNSAAESED